MIKKPQIISLKVRDNLTEKEIPEYGVYYVTSQSGEEDYKVDLTQRITEDGRAHGVCQCTWFDCVANPNLEKFGCRVPYNVTTGIVRDSATECKHIAAALAKYHRDITQFQFAAFKDGITS